PGFARTPPFSACLIPLFFYSSRRRHTRSDRDWSSDVCSSDLATAHPDLRFLEQVKQIRMSGCSMKINLALDGLPSFKALPGTRPMPHHKTTIHICPDVDYVERAFDDAKYGVPSRRPLLEITIPTTYDDSIAPPGKHIMN